MLEDHVLLLSRLPQLYIEMVFYCLMFDQTSFAHLATERFMRQTRCWTKVFDHLTRA